MLATLSMEFSVTYYSELWDAIAFHNIFHFFTNKEHVRIPTYSRHFASLGTLSDPNNRLIILLAIDNSKQFQKSTNTN